MARMSAFGKPESESTGVRIQLSPDVPVEPLRMVVEKCATGTCGCGCAADFETITVEETAHGPQIHVQGDHLPVASIANAMEQCEAPETVVTHSVPPDGPADDARRTAIQERYGQIAETAEKDGLGSGFGCGCGGVVDDLNGVGLHLGYTVEELTSVPSDANLGLGCGNPGAISQLQPGETVLDLGSGGGLDCLLAARQVGVTGRVIGVDMTPAMISRARRIAASDSAYAHVEFRLGEIEHLPVADKLVDVILSNCVINLSTNKRQVFHEAYRVLKPGGRLAISDIVSTVEIPADWRNDEQLWTSCMAGAMTINELETLMVEVGFTAIRIHPQPGSRDFIQEWVPNTPLTDYVVSAVIEAFKP